jgi:hypothetical protein
LNYEANAGKSKGEMVTEKTDFEAYLFSLEFI